MSDKYDSTAAYAEHLEMDERVTGCEANIEGLHEAFAKLESIERAQEMILKEMSETIRDLVYRISMAEGVAADITEIKAKIR